jgi:hypothetical protein
MNRKREKNVHSQISRLEKNPEELQLHHNHEKFLFLTVLLLFVKFIIGDLTRLDSYRILKLLISILLSKVSTKNGRE